MRNLILAFALIFISNFSLSFTIKQFMDMEKSGYTEEIEIYFSGLWSGADAVNEAVFDKYGDTFFCRSLKSPDPKKMIEDTISFLKLAGPAITPVWEKETDLGDFYQAHISIAFMLMIGTYYECKNDPNVLGREYWKDIIEKFN